MPAAHLETLNSQQRRAAEHGVEGQSAHSRPPLLVIAGAGSDKSAEGDRHVYPSRMRFIPDSILSIFTRRAWPTIRAGGRVGVDPVSKRPTQRRSENAKHLAMSNDPRRC